jgi:MoaA/NifB/PqqE/SkfB family radical SAM enzyme
MCDSNRRKIGKKKLLNRDRYDEILDLLVARGVSKIDFQGLGEPLLNPNLPYMISKASEKDIDTGVTTNASLLFLGVIAKLAKAGINRLEVSIDGVEGAVYEKIRRKASFRQLLQNLLSVKEFRNKNPTFSLQINFVLMKENIRQLPSMMYFASVFGAEKVWVLHKVNVANQSDIAENEKIYGLRLIEVEGIFSETRNIADILGITLHLPRLYPRERTNGCLISSKTVTIDINGNFYPCCRLDRPEHCIGNVKEGTKIFEKTNIFPRSDFCNFCLHYLWNYEDLVG